MPVQSCTTAEIQASTLENPTGYGDCLRCVYLVRSLMQLIGDGVNVVAHPQEEMIDSSPAVLGANRYAEASASCIKAHLPRADHRALVAIGVAIGVGSLQLAYGFSRHLTFI